MRIVFLAAVALLAGCSYAYHIKVDDGGSVCIECGDEQRVRAPTTEVSTHQFDERAE